MTDKPQSYARIELSERLFAERRPHITTGRKTVQWSILSRRGVVLGEIAWFSPYRQYTLTTESCATFNCERLRDIAAFLERLNTERKETKNAGNKV